MFRLRTTYAIHDKAVIAKRSEVHSITTQNLVQVAATELMDGDNSVYLSHILDHHYINNSKSDFFSYSNEDCQPLLPSTESRENTYSEEAVRHTS